MKPLRFLVIAMTIVTIALFACFVIIGHAEQVPARTASADGTCQPIGASCVSLMDDTSAIFSLPLGNANTVLISIEGVQSVMFSGSNSTEVYRTIATFYQKAYEKNPREITALLVEQKTTIYLKDGRAIGYER